MAMELTEGTRVKLKLATWVSCFIFVVVASFQVGQKLTRIDDGVQRTLEFKKKWEIPLVEMKIDIANIKKNMPTKSTCECYLECEEFYEEKEDKVAQF
jgi:hypothetical protein